MTTSGRLALTLSLMEGILCVSCHYHPWIVTALRLLSLPTVASLLIGLAWFLHLRNTPNKSAYITQWAKKEARYWREELVDSVVFTTMLLLPLQLGALTCALVYLLFLGVAYYHSEHNALGFVQSILMHALHDTIYPYLAYLFLGAWYDIPLTVPVLDAVVAVAIGSVLASLTSSATYLVAPRLGQL